MNFLKLQTSGLDTPVQQYQSYLYAALKKQWGIANDTDLDLYGRVYKQQDADGFTPMAYMGGKEYREVYFNDTRKATGFFLIGETIKYLDGSASADAALIICCSMQKLHPSLDMGADEVIHGEVQKLCHPLKYGFELTGFMTGIDNVFKEFSGWRKKDSIKNRDYYPLHCFRINFNLLYNILN
jgi:hypothetical protein